MIRAICRAVIGIMNFVAAMVVSFNATQIASVKFRSVIPSFVVSILGIFLIAGLIVLPDYGISEDEITQRNLAVYTADYIFWNNDYLLYERDRYYGVAFEMLLLFVERILVLEDSRRTYLKIETQA